MKSTTMFIPLVLRRLPSLVAITVSASMLSLNAFAQDASPKSNSDAQLDEIIVTGTKRELSLMDVAAAVSVITSKDLENSVYNDVC